MMKKKMLPLLSLMAVMALVACGSTGGSKDSSTKTSSAGSVTNSSKPSSSKSSTSRAPVLSVTTSEVALNKKEDGVYLTIKGKVQNLAEGAKWAVGLVVYADENGKTNDEGTFAYGSASPADTDYSLTPTIADGNYTVELKLTGIAGLNGWGVGVYAGPKGAYSKIEFSEEMNSVGKVSDGSFKYFISAYYGGIRADEVAPIDFRETAIVKDDEGNVFLKFGGERAEDLTQEVIDTKPSAMDFQRSAWNGGSYSKININNGTNEDGTSKWDAWHYEVVGNKAYVLIKLNGVRNLVAPYGYQLHYAFNTTKTADFQLADDVAAFSKDYIFNETKYTIYYNPTGSGEEEHWGCLALRLSDATGEPDTEEEEDVTGEKAVALTGLDIVKENNKSIIKVSGTISGYKSSERNFAFGLVSREASGSDSVAGNWLVGSENPEDADFKYKPTVSNGEFTVKFDVTDVEFTGGVYTLMCGPKENYVAFSGTTGLGNGDAKVNGYRIYIRSDLGAIAADQLPPIALTDSYLAVEDGKIYHYIGGELGIPEADFLAKTPYLNYEKVLNWGKNVMDASLVSTTVKNGKGFVKVDVSGLGVERYNVKLNLNAAADVDTQMETIINTEDDKVEFDGKTYYILADKSHAGDKNYIYGNLGLVVEKAPKPAATFVDGKLRIEAENYDSTSNRASVSAKDDAEASGGKYLSGLDSYNEETYYNFTLAEDVNVKILVRYNCSKDPNGYGPMEFYIDGAEIDGQNRGSSEAGWKVREIPAQALKAGAHEIKIRNPYQSVTDYDYVELVKVAA